MIVHALVHAINRQLGNIERTVEYVEPVESRPDDQLRALTDLVDRMKGDQIKAMIVLGGNPVYNTPQELDFAKAYDRVPYRVHLSPEFDETSFVSHWHIPKAHSLEAWSDARAFDGTTTIQQPLIAPLYGGRTDHEVIAAIARWHCRADCLTRSLREYWKTRFSTQDFEKQWRQSVHDGVIPSTQADSRTPDWKFVDQSFPEKCGRLPAEAPSLEISFCPDPSIWDGRFANNGWLQELPKPITKLTWDNAALISPRTAERLRVANHEVVELSLSGRTVRAPAWIVPGQPDDSISLSFGYGRTRSGRNATGIGVNALRSEACARPRISPTALVAETDGPALRTCGNAASSQHGRPRPGARSNPDAIQGKSRFPLARAKVSARFTNSVSKAG